MNIIHMETETVRSVAQQMGQIMAEMHGQVQTIRNQVQTIDWQGPSREEFVAEFGVLSQSMNSMTDEGGVLAERVQREVDEWEGVDKAFGEGARINALSNTQSDGGEMGIGAGLGLGGGGGSAWGDEVDPDYYRFKEYFLLSGKQYQAHMSLQGDAQGSSVEDYSMFKDYNSQSRYEEYYYRLYAEGEISFKDLAIQIKSILVSFFSQQSSLNSEKFDGQKDVRQIRDELLTFILNNDWQSVLRNLRQLGIKTEYPFQRKKEADLLDSQFKKCESVFEIFFAVDQSLLHKPCPRQRCQGLILCLIRRSPVRPAGRRGWYPRTEFLHIGSLPSAEF